MRLAVSLEVNKSKKPKLSKFIKKKQKEDAYFAASFLCDFII
jgi:hypothetical protein